MHTGRFLPVMSGPRLPIGLLDRFTPDELARMRHIERVYERTLSGALQSSGSGPLASAINALRGP